MARVTASAFGLVALVVIFAASFAPPATAAPGDVDWVKHWTPTLSNQVTWTQMARAPSGDYYVAAKLWATPSYVLGRFRANGSRRWGHLYGSGPSLAFSGLAVDPHGNAVLTGSAETSGVPSSWLTMKVSPAGKRLWTRRAGSGTSSASGVAVDKAGNIYVAGALVRAGHGQDYAVRKYSPMGVLRWARYVDGSTHGNDQAMALAVGPDGRVYVAGWVNDVGTQDDAVVACYSAAGSRAWLRRWNRSADLDDRLWALDVSKAGVAVAGESALGVSGIVQPLTCVYTTKGTLKWAVALDSPAGQSFWGTVDIDGSGHVGVGGDVDLGSPDAPLCACTRYGPGASGGDLDVFQNDGSPVAEGGCQQVRLAAGGALYCTGWVLTDTGTDLAAMRVAGDLTHWETQYHDSGGGPSAGYAFMLTPSTMYVSGRANDDPALWKLER